MPWDIKDHNGKHCLFKKGMDTPIKGGCHESLEAAERHRRALYANAASECFASLIPVVQFAEKAGEANAVWIEAVPLDEWEHPLFGDINFTRDRADRMIDNFDRNIRGHDIALDFEHGFDPSKGTRASGWLKEMKIDKASNTEMREESLWWLVEFTDEAKEEIEEGAWRYFSPEWIDLWQHPHTEVFYMDVATGGGLTNKPHIKGMLPINFTEVIAEVADVEHSDPGTGVPPIPRETTTEKDAQEGWRVDTPPIVTELEDNMEEFLKKFCELLGLPDDADMEVVLAEVAKLHTEITPLREAAVSADKEKTFREQYPEEYERMQRLEVANRESEAKRFAEQFERFTEEKDGATVKSDKGFSALVLTKVEDFHKKFSERNAQPGDLKEILDAIAAGGIVEFNEHGSSRESGNSESTETDPKRIFAEKVKELMTEDNLAYADAAREAVKRFPDEYRQYREAITQNKVVA